MNKVSLDLKQWSRIFYKSNISLSLSSISDGLKLAKTFYFLAISFFVILFYLVNTAGLKYKVLHRHCRLSGGFLCGVCTLCLHGFPQGALKPENMEIRWIGNIKFVVGVNVLVLVFSPVIDCQPVWGVPCLSSSACWDRIQHPKNPEND